MERRAFLRAAAAALPAVAATGCAVDDFIGPRDSVRVAVTWSAAELEAFRAVLAGLKTLPGFPKMTYRVDPIPLGDDIEAALGTRGIGRPDVVMLPRPGLVKASLAELEPLPLDAWKPSSYGKLWRDLLLDDNTGKPYGLPFKAAHKSLVWYRKDRFPDPSGLGDARTWRGLSLGAADGWVLTDFFENVLYGLSRKVYGELATATTRDWDRPEVRTALETLGRIWGAEGALAGGVERSVQLQFPDAVEEVFRFERADLVVAPDFAEPIIAAAFRDDQEYAERVGVVPFPALVEGAMPPLIAGGEFAVLTSPASEATRDFVRRLADPRAPEPWLRTRGGFVPANRSTEVTYTPQLRRLLGRLRGDNGFAFDLSDQIGGAGGRDGLWRVLDGFLREVGDGHADRAGAARDRAIGRLTAFERQVRSLTGEPT